MKKLLIAVGITAAVSASAQKLSSINRVLDKIAAPTLEQQAKYPLEGKTFFTTVDLADHSERHILEFQSDNKITLIELIEDKQTGNNFSNIFTGDVMRKENQISVRADKLENRLIAIPVVHNFLLRNSRGVWYLKDINTGKQWREAQIIKKR